MTIKQQIKFLENEIKIIKERWEPHTSKSYHSIWLYMTDRIKELRKKLDESS
tara:strand:- start:109 stop:264 length:156 start_codon:yes stop_codon:yes gene_type:complete